MKKTKESTHAVAVETLMDLAQHAQDELLRLQAAATLLDFENVTIKEVPA